MALVRQREIPWKKIWNDSLRIERSMAIYQWDYGGRTIDLLRHSSTVPHSDILFSFMEDDETELRNPFPSPPSHYTRYTTRNLKLLTLLRERAGDDAPIANQREVLSDQMEVPDWQLVQLEKPCVDWILDEPEAFYDVFGDRWFVRLCFVVISIH